MTQPPLPGTPAFGSTVVELQPGRKIDAGLFAASAGLFRMTPEQYHADPVEGGSLSATGLRSLIPPDGCPARYRYDQDHGRPAPKSDAFDVGHLAHRLVLGAGADIEVIDAPDWTRKATREARDAARDAGLTPVLTAQYERGQAMAAAVMDHPEAGALFTDGLPEVVGVWVEEDGTRCRMMIDWLRTVRKPRLIIPDLKTCESGEPGGLDRVIYNHGYHIQAAWYTRGATRLGLADRVAFVWVFVEKIPPHIVTVAQPTEAAMRIGAIQAQQAISTYRSCVESGRWPGYSDDIELIGLPTWVEYEYAQEISR